MQAFIITLISFIIKPQKRKLIKWSYKLRTKTGLEIGGPSSIFGLKGYFPVYAFARQIDSVNFSNETVWEGKISEGKTFNYFGSKKGHQFIQEASELKNIPEESYDFLLSSHSLEHIANPIKALKLWHKLVKPKGEFILILPDKRNTFDLKRPYTSLQHLIEDYRQDVDEYDNTHFDEILSNYSPQHATEANSIETVKENLRNNFVNRYAHHHVFNFEMIRDLLAYCGFETVYQQSAAPFHLVTIAIKK